MHAAGYSVFSCACSLVRPHCSGCPFPSTHLKALGSETQGHARDRDSRAALGNPQDKRHKLPHNRQTYSGRSSRVATRPESQSAPPHIFNLPRRLSPPSHGSADRQLRPVAANSESIKTFIISTRNWFQCSICAIFKSHFVRLFPPNRVPSSLLSPPPPHVIRVAICKSKIRQSYLQLR